MKKNLISVIILAMVVANFILTVLMVFTIWPQSQKTNNLIDKICSAIDLDLNCNGGTGMSNVPIENIEDYTLNGGEELTVNLAKGEDGKDHYAVLIISLSLNNQSEGYEKFGPEELAKKENIILNNVNQVIRQFTKEDFRDTQKVQDAILENLQKMFGESDFIVGVNFSKVVTE